MSLSTPDAPPAVEPCPARGRTLALFATGVIVALVVLVLMTLLPHDRYIRWQSLQTEAYARLGWDYERIHFDKTPIDIAFLGTSHTMNGVDAETVERGLAANGARTNDGRCYTATNFSIPAYGRNLHWEIARELFENRPVKLLVLEVFENETRKAHPAFVHVADAKDVIRAPLVINLNYFNDLVRLPFRQLSLWAETLAPGQFGLKPYFDPNNFDGSTVDNTRAVNVGGVALTPPRTRTMRLETLKAKSAAFGGGKNLHMLGSRFAGLEYRYPLHYLNGILDEARSHGTKVVFLYLPAYGQPDRPYDMRPYAGKGDFIYVTDILHRPELWYDEAHLNAQGAALLSQRLTGDLKSELPNATAGPMAATGCDFGVPARPITVQWGSDHRP